VLRGGSWNNNDRDNLLSSNRNNNSADNRNNNNGFRLVLVGVSVRKVSERKRRDAAWEPVLRRRSQEGSPNPVDRAPTIGEKTRRPPWPVGPARTGTESHSGQCGRRARRCESRASVWECASPVALSPAPSVPLTPHREPAPRRGGRSQPQPRLQSGSGLPQSKTSRSVLRRVRGPARMAYHRPASSVHRQQAGVLLTPPRPFETTAGAVCPSRPGWRPGRASGAVRWPCGLVWCP